MSHQDVDGVGGPVLAPRCIYVNSLQKIEGEIYVDSHGFPRKMTQSIYGISAQRCILPILLIEKRLLSLLMALKIRRLMRLI
jgi:hypothetical protein